MSMYQLRLQNVVFCFSNPAVQRICHYFEKECMGRGRSCNEDWDKILKRRGIKWQMQSRGPHSWVLAALFWLQTFSHIGYNHIFTAYWILPPKYHNLCFLKRTSAMWIAQSPLLDPLERVPIAEGLMPKSTRPQKQSQLEAGSNADVLICTRYCKL